MSVQELSLNIKRFLGSSETITVAIIISMGISSFWLGRLSVEDSSELAFPELNIQNSAGIRAGAPSSVPRVEAEETKYAPNLMTSESSGTPEGGYVASKSGTKYHLPWCGSAKRIKEENKIWFATKVEAEAAGYSPAANCKGI